MATIAVAMETLENNFSGSQKPKANSVYDLGETDFKWRTLYVDKVSVNGQLINITDLYYKGAPGGDPLLKTGGVMSGAVKFNSNQWGIGAGVTTKAYALDLSNSDIIGTNAIIFSDNSDSATEGLCFPKTGKGGSTLPADYDTIRAMDGLFYFNSNEVYHAGNKPTPAEIGTIVAGDWSTNGAQDLKVHGKRALVGFTNGELHLGYGGDFSTIKCGNGYTVYHSGNLGSDDSLTLKNLSLGNAYITMGGRVLSIQYAEPVNPTEGTIWIK